MKDFIEFIARRLVDRPEEVEIEEVHQDDKVLLRLKVAPSDIGKVIGKRGRTAFALRILTAAVGKRQGLRVDLTIVEPQTVDVPTAHIEV
jgi:uncharacterized protein